MQASHLTYHEPTISTILLQSSFIFALNLINYLLDHAFHCGLVGQILIGTAWGIPGGNLLDEGFQKAVVQLGYLGLLLLVYEGGLTTSLGPLLTSLRPSLLVAATGIILPVAISFLLLPLDSASPLHAFASGAALSSTSLGTTFTILQSCGVVGTRIGTVLTSAAMVDDVVGLVMIAVVAGLGGDEVKAGTVIRPLFASIGLLAANVGLGWIAVTVGLQRVQLGRWKRWAGDKNIALILQVPFLASFLAIAGYAGASVLFAAFLAGMTLSWWHALRHPSSSPSSPSPEEINNYHLAAPTKYLLKPFFFASIGFAIPIRRMFTGEVVWKGLVYTVLMFVGKLLTGLWLIGADASDVETKDVDRQEAGSRQEEGNEEKAEGPQQPVLRARSSESRKSWEGKLFAPSLVGLAMVARGEIGFLIVGSAEAAGIYEGKEELYMITIWAIFLCTILGPVSVGVLMRSRNKRLR